MFILGGCYGEPSFVVINYWFAGICQAVDIFAASSASSITRLSLMKEIAKLWNIPTSQVDSLYPPNKPIIQVIFYLQKCAFYDCL